MNILTILISIIITLVICIVFNIIWARELSNMLVDLFKQVEDRTERRLKIIHTLVEQKLDQVQKDDKH